MSNIEYEILVDKETYFPNALNMVMDMTINLEDQTYTAVQNMSDDYKDFNEINPITVP